MKATSDEGNEKEFQVKARVDSPVEVEYLRNGGILQTVLRQMLREEDWGQEREESHAEKVLVTREIPDAGLRLLRDFDVTVASEGRRAGEPSKPSWRGRHLTDRHREDGRGVMDAAGDRLKVIANMAVGYDNIDVEAATERGVVVTNTLRS